MSSSIFPRGCRCSRLGPFTCPVTLGREGARTSERAAAKCLAFTCSSPLTYPWVPRTFTCQPFTGRLGIPLPSPSRCKVTMVESGAHFHCSYLTARSSSSTPALSTDHPPIFLPVRLSLARPPLTSPHLIVLITILTRDLPALPCTPSLPD